MSDPDQWPYAEQARRLVQEGRTAEAHAHMEGVVRRVESEHGAKSFEAANAFCCFASVLIAGGRPDLAVESLRKALRCVPEDDEQEKFLITVENELARALERNGQVALAERAFLKALEQREEFYGREHHGYGFGLHWYASFLARQGDPRALKIAEEALQNLTDDFHPKAAEVIVLVARLMARQGHADPFSRFRLDGPLWDTVGEAMSSGLDEFPAPIILDAVDSYLRLDAQTLPLRARGRLAAHEIAFGVARESGDYTRMFWHAEVLQVLRREKGDKKGEHWATMELSFAAEKLGDLPRAEALLKEAVRLANDLDGPARSYSLRQLGIFHAHRGHAEAEMVLRNALLEALILDDPIEAGKTRVALGLHLQHDRQFDEARELLTEAIASLDPASRQAFSARSHLDAIEHGRGCGCGDSERATLETFEALLRPELPEGLLEAVVVVEGQLALRLVREPTEEENALLERVWAQAILRMEQASSPVCRIEKGS